MVPHGPVGGVESDLGGNHDDEDGGDHRAEEVVISQHQSSSVRLVVVRACKDSAHFAHISHTFSGNSDSLTHRDHEEHHGGDKAVQGRDGELAVVK